MDKLRALHYLIAAAEANSFSGAARQLGVSVAAVARLVGALEANLGIRLFERHSHGLVPTTAGSAYIEACEPALTALAEADEQATAVATRVRGKVVLGTQPVLMQEAVARALPRFAALYPEIQLDLRFVKQTREPAARGVDVFLLLGWPQSGDLVHRHMAVAEFMICAAPSYWAAHGMPTHPSDLERHNCFSLRGNSGPLMDLWQFRRGDERVSVAARGSLLTDDVHRDTLVQVVLAGAGVARVLDWPDRRRELASGALVRALADWKVVEVPPVNVLYPPTVRRALRVRVFVDFLTQLFVDLEKQREHGIAATGKPQWERSGFARASATLGRR